VRYTEQLRFSWNYHWGIFREIWDMFTLRNYHWLVVGLLVVLCVVPVAVVICEPRYMVDNRVIGSVVEYYIRTPRPPFDPTLSQDIISPYFFIVKTPPSILAVVIHCWVMGDNFKPMARVLSLASVGLLLIAWLREDGLVRGREE